MEATDVTMIQVTMTAEEAQDLYDQTYAMGAIADGVHGALLDINNELYKLGFRATNPLGEGF